MTAKPKPVRGKTEFGDLVSERWLARRIAEHARVSTMRVECEIFDGLTTPEIRQQRLRALVQRLNLGVVLCGRNAEGKSMTYDQALDKLYGAVKTNTQGNSDVDTDAA